MQLLQFRMHLQLLMRCKLQTPGMDSSPAMTIPPHSLRQVRRLKQARRGNAVRDQLMSVP